MSALTLAKVKEGRREDIKYNSLSQM